MSHMYLFLIITLHPEKNQCCIYIYIYTLNIFLKNLLVFSFLWFFTDEYFYYRYPNGRQLLFRYIFMILDISAAKQEVGCAFLLPKCFSHFSF